MNKNTLGVRPGILSMMSAAILSAALCTMASDVIILPILDLLFTQFPDTSNAIIVLAHNIAGFAFIPASVVTPVLCRNHSIKRLMIAGTVLCIIGGGFGGMITNIYYIVIMHFIEGFGAGICANMIPIYIAKIWTREQDVLRLNALNGTAGTFLGLMVTLISGKVAEMFGWKAAYYVYFLEILVLIMQLVYLPDISPDERKKKAVKHIMNCQIVRWLCEVFVFSVFINLFGNYLAGYLAEKQLGGADVSGIAIALLQVGGFLVSFILAPVMKKAGSYHQNVSFALFILSAGIVIFASSTMVVYCACVIWGFGQGLIFPYLWAQATLIAPDDDAVASVVSWTTIAWYLAVGVSSFIYAPISFLFHDSSASFAIKTVLVAFVILSIYRLFMATWECKKEIR